MSYSQASYEGEMKLCPAQPPQAAGWKKEGCAGSQALRRSARGRTRYCSCLKKMRSPQTWKAHRENQWPWKKDLKEKFRLHHGEVSVSEITLSFSCTSRFGCNLC